MIDHTAERVALWRALHLTLDAPPHALRDDIGLRLARVFEVDQPDPQQWKRQRLTDLGYGVPEHLRLVPVDFETADWWQALLTAGFDPTRPALVASTGVSMYLTTQAIMATLQRVAALVTGSMLVMTFQLPDDLLDEADRPARRASVEGARAAGTPFLSEDILIATT